MSSKKKPIKIPERGEGELRVAPKDKELFRIRMKANVMRTIMDAVSSVVDEAEFLVSPKDGLRLRQMNTEHTGMMEMILPVETFEVWDVEGDDGMRFSVMEMGRVLSRLAKGDSIELAVISNKIKVAVIGKRERRFEIPSFALIKEKVGEPKSVLDCKFKIQTDGLVQAMKDAEVATGEKGKKEYGAHVIFSAASAGLIIKAESSSGFRTSQTTLSIGWDLMEVDAKKGEAIYGLAYVKPLIEYAAKITNIIQLEFGQDLPCRIEPQLPFKGKLYYWLAPRIFKD